MLRIRTHWTADQSIIGFWCRRGGCCPILSIDILRNRNIKDTVSANYDQSAAGVSSNAVWMTSSITSVRLSLSPPTYYSSLIKPCSLIAHAAHNIFFHVSYFINVIVHTQIEQVCKFGRIINNISLVTDNSADESDSFLVTLIELYATTLILSIEYIMGFIRTSFHAHDRLIVF